MLIRENQQVKITDGNVSTAEKTKLSGNNFKCRKKFNYASGLPDNGNSGWSKNGIKIQSLPPRQTTFKTPPYA